MGIRVNTNITSQVAQRHLRDNSADQRLSLERLSSGVRINRASDDSAGLAIAEKMRAQIRSIRQDMRNANDGVSMVQTAEGAMNESANILVRLRELSIQGASDTLGDNERGFIDKEFQMLHKELDRIAESTEYNGIKLLNGNSQNLEVQIGVNHRGMEDQLDFKRSEFNVTTASMGLKGTNVKTTTSSRDNLAVLDNALSHVSDARASMGALQNNFVSTMNRLRIYDENLTEARSRITDTDFAKESAELARSNVLNQAAISVLSQANTLPTVALKLLG